MSQTNARTRRAELAAPGSLIQNIFELTARDFKDFLAGAAKSPPEKAATRLNKRGAAA
jgi:hypothetical protein